MCKDCKYYMQCFVANGFNQPDTIRRMFNCFKPTKEWSDKIRVMMSLNVVS